MHKRGSFVPSALLLLAGPALSAQDVRVGVQGALAFPANDLTDVANLGLQLGGHARWDFGRGHGLMARLDVTLYGSKDGASTTSFGGGADYTYHVDHDRRGLYLLAGATLTSYSVSGGGTASRSGLGLDVGAGYDLTRNLGLQLRYTTHSLDGATMSSLNLGATWSF